MSAISLFDEEPIHPLTAPDVIREYLKDLGRKQLAGKLSQGHLTNTADTLANFAAFVGERRLPECRQYDLTEWMHSNPAWKSSNTQKRVIAAVLACFRWAEDEELIDRCPYRRPRALRGLQESARRPAEIGEYVALMRHGTRALRRALFFLRRTGARTCEMREVTWPDVHLDADTPHILLERHKTSGSGIPRKIGLDPAMVTFLGNLMRGSDSSFVFVNCDGGPWDRHTFARHLRRTAKRIGLDEGVADRVSAYCLRHTFACDAIIAGFTSKQVGDLLGHRDGKMVDRVYAQATRKKTSYLGGMAGEVIKRRKGNRKPKPGG